jgi:hypothetical protein
MAPMTPPLHSSRGRPFAVPRGGVEHHALVLSGEEADAAYSNIFNMLLAVSCARARSDAESLLQYSRSAECQRHSQT